MIEKLQEKLFLESQEILTEISKIEDKQDFWLKRHLFKGIADRISMLEYLEDYEVEEETLTEEIEMIEAGQSIEEESIKSESAVSEIYISHDEGKEHPQEKIKLAKIKSPNFVKSNLPIPSFDKNISEGRSKGRDFMLDLNDRIAFTKVLFKGNQIEMNEVLAKLNTFGDLETAREYLSDIYHSKNWSSVDEYAQRLWSLVEEKFS